MMGSTERDILNRIKTDCAAITTGGGYNYSFDGSDQVQIGTELEPVRVPGVYIHPLNVSTAQTAGKTRLNSYDRTMTVQIDVFVPTTSSAPGTAILAAVDAQSDVMKALENDRSLGGTIVRDIEIDASAYDGAELDMAKGIAVATLMVKIIYTERAGS